MRALLYALLLTNVLFFTWAHWIDAPRPGAHRFTPLLAAAAANPSAAGSAAGTASGTSSGGSAGAAPGSGAASATGARCASLGPLAATVDATALRVGLQARNLQARERQATVVQAEGYWVYIDKLTDAQSRARALQRLSRAGLRDAAALADSGQVSVGLFNEQAGADKRAAAVRAAGFEPVIEPRNHSVEQYWLDVNLPADVPLPAVAALATGLNLGNLPQWGSCP
jgi:hypothetical protein